MDEHENWKNVNSRTQLFVMTDIFKEYKEYLSIVKGARNGAVYGY